MLYAELCWHGSTDGKRRASRSTRCEHAALLLQWFLSRVSRPTSGSFFVRSDDMTVETALIAAEAASPKG